MWTGSSGLEGGPFVGCCECSNKPSGFIGITLLADTL